MSCEFESRVSLWIDGELSGEEARRVEAHLAACATCRRTREDFESVGTMLRTREPVAGRDVDAVRDRILASGSESFWRRSVTVSWPVAASTVVCLVGLAAWTTYQAIDREPDTRVRRADVLPAEADPLDHGGFPVVYKEPRDAE